MTKTNHPEARLKVNLGSPRAIQEATCIAVGDGEHSDREVANPSPQLHGEGGARLLALIRLVMILLTGHWAHAQDLTPPTIVAITSSAPNSNGWYRGNVRVSYSCQDTGGSGIARYPASQLVSSEGANQWIVATVSDRAGNTSTNRLSIRLDRTAPVVTAVRSPAPSPNGWVTSPVTVTFSASDALSGVESGSLTPPIVFSTDRNNATATGRAMDLAGNSGVVQMNGIKIDTTPPRISVTLSPAQTGSGWRNAPVTAHFNCTDSGSGIASCPSDRLFNTEGRGLMVTGTAADNVGFTATVTAYFNIDLTPPTVTTVLSRPPDVNGWYTAPVTATFNCFDALSGMYQQPSPVLVSAEGANQPLGVTVMDRARNVATPAETVSLDLTAPTLTILNPSAPVEVETARIAIRGTATDGASGIRQVTIQGVPMVLQADGTFEHVVTLVEGSNVIQVVATDRVGRATSHSMTVTRMTPPPAPVNLFADPRFESGVSGVFAQDASSSVAQTSTAPLEGASSLRVSINGYGNNVWWIHEFAGGLASHFSVSARVRSDVASSSELQFCGMVYFADGTTDTACTTISGVAGDKGVVSVELPIDPTRRLQSVNWRLYQEGSAGVVFTFDDAVAQLAVIEAPTTGGGGGGGDGGGDGGGGGGGSIGCPIPEAGSSAYPGFNYALPSTRPFISLTQYLQTDPASTAFQRFRFWADQAVAGNPPYAYSAVSSVVMYRATGESRYIQDAINRVEDFVVEAEAAIAAGARPAISGDSYLEVGWYLEQLALAYDSGFDRLTPEQRARWAGYAEQTLFNLWHPSEASWGGVSHPWTGWSICDPGNNYHFHFLRATMLWALATKSTAWLEFLQVQKFPRLIDYYMALPGGGSREGTGYGTAQKDLFENYLLWRDSTGEDLSALTVHARQTIDYWVHATVPTRDRFAPIGDQSRSSMPDLFDYHENLVHAAVVLNRGTPEAGRGTWWLNNNSVNGVSQAFNLLGDLLPLLDAPVMPVDRVYHASGAGVLFARSSWATDASWLAFVAGKYDQSHAHQDQGAFTFFKRDWLSATPNIWSNSGINQETQYHNTVRFERADGTTIAQNPDDSAASTLSHGVVGERVTLIADLSNAFSARSTLVQNWTRSLDYEGDILRVSDRWSVGAGVRAVVQVQVPVVPVVQADGSVVAGALRIVPLQPSTVRLHPMPAGFSRGHRVEFVPSSGNTFSMELRAQ